MEVGTPNQVPLNARNFYAYVTFLNNVLCFIVTVCKNDTRFVFNYYYKIQLNKFNLCCC